ncbi:glycosyltransferase [Saccharicrinis sp. FJH54]|uniref:glycosyltransferase n=1 Tax=Saccharicrinis sp. FJH54 TaxID=3344665 RepID=UPI0035D51411
MKIIQLQYSTNSAASSAIRLNDLMKEYGICSKILSLRPDDYPYEDITYTGIKERIISKANSYIHNILVKNPESKNGKFTQTFLGSNVADYEIIKKSDVIYIHWVLGGFFNLNSFAKIADLGKPVVIFLHDMWMITGGCHHSFDCEKFKTSCSKCPVLESRKSNDWSKIQFKMKLKLISSYSNLYFVSPSKWLFEKAKDSKLLREKEIFHIPNIVPESNFKPIDKKTAKSILNIEPNQKVISFGATSVDSPYKGWKYLKSALNQLAKKYKYEDITLLIFGAGLTKDDINTLPFKTIYLGKLTDRFSTQITYNAADVFVAPSLADVGPMTVVESLKCGTPVVGFNIGGIPDVLVHKSNGYLAQYKNPSDLSDGLAYCLTHVLFSKASEDFSDETIIKKHLDLIKYLINKNANF